MRQQLSLRTLYVFAMGSALLASGCLAYHAQPISALNMAADFETRTLDDPGLKKFIETNLRQELSSWPPKSWNFTLLNFAALYYHPDMDMARASWKTTQASVRVAKGKQNPILKIVPEFVSNENPGVTPWILGFDLDIPVETMGKRRYRTAKAQHLSEAARLRMAGVAWHVRSRLRERLLDLHAAAQTTSSLHEILVLEEEHVKMMRVRSTAHDVSPLAMNEAQLEYDSIVLSLSDAKKKEAEARVQVADALGLPVASLQHIQLAFQEFHHLPFIEKNHLEKIRHDALLNRSDILAALAEYAASQSALQLEIAKQYPDIHLGPGYTFDQDQNKWALGISIPLPILSHNQGSIAEASARREESKARFIVLQAHVIADIDQAWEAYRVMYQTASSLESLLATRLQQQKLLEMASGTGEARRVSLLRSKRDLAALTISYLEKLRQTQKSLGLLEDAVQLPLQPEQAPLITPEKNPHEGEKPS